MSSNKPAVPKGTRDISPEQYAKRSFIFNTIESVFKKYAYKPIETPAMELLTTLTGKYGDEGDKLIFKILNSGNYLSDVDSHDYEEKNTSRLVPQICEKALRYDLTVPFARYVVQHFNDITFPFRRYQIQPVWRADRPQKGRYREFFQCDIDVIGSNALINEAELLKITDEIFQKLGIGIIIKINNRKILTGIAEVIGEKEKIIDITVALDKLDKIGKEKVLQELLEKEMPRTAVDKIAGLIDMAVNEQDILQAISVFTASSEIAQKGIEEVKEILSLAEKMQVKAQIAFDVTLARGLNYYTGAILEVKTTAMEMGSISGGGRYDDLTGIFGLKDVSGVGISYGADRIYDVMEALELFPEALSFFTKVLFVNLGHKEMLYVLPLLSELRALNIPSELYPDSVKMKKQMAYADKNNMAFVVIAGAQEIEDKTFTLKNMQTGQQYILPYEQALNFLKENCG